MEFSLTYRGPLPGNGDAKEKQTIREYLHPQLKELWNQPPLNGKQQLWTATPILENENITLLESREGFNFVALVSNRFHLAADLHITFLRNGPPGSLISRGGDLDNRLKTLFDALAFPTNNQIRQAPPTTRPPDNFFCLLEDDSLIYSFGVAADRLLDGSRVHVHHEVNPDHPELEVLVLVRVSTRTTELKIWNMDL
jgi:hypothetical protein